MASGNIVLSMRRPGRIVLPVTLAAYDQQIAVTPTAAAAVADIVATYDDQIWEVVFDVPVRVLFGDAPVVTPATGRWLQPNVPYFFAARAGQKLSYMLG